MLSLHRVTAPPGGGRTFVLIADFARMSECRKAARRDGRRRHAAGETPCYYVVHDDGFRYRGRLDVVVVRTPVPKARPVPAFSAN